MRPGAVTGVAGVTGVDLVLHRNNSTVHWWLAFITTRNGAGLRAQQGDEQVRHRIMESLVRVDAEWAWNREGQAGSGICVRAMLLTKPQ